MIIRKTAAVLAVLLLLLAVLIMIPRALSLMHPDRPPVGYHFVPAAYLAIWLRLEQLADLAPSIPDSIEEIKDVEYKNINGLSLQLDMYLPRNKEPGRPLLVFIHGGGWKSGKRSDYLVYLVAFAKKGYSTATISYRLLDKAPYPACAEDISDAVKWLYANSGKYGYDEERMALIGGSAGAHLAMLGAYGWAGATGYHPGADSSDAPRIKAIVDIYGPADLTTEYGRKHPLVTGFISHSYDESPALYAQASPMNYIDASDPPTLIFHGTSDDLVPVSQSDSLKARLDRIGVPCEYYRLPLWPHTMDIVRRVNDFCVEKMELFFREYL